jgi:hypothetical protein
MRGLGVGVGMLMVIHIGYNCCKFNQNYHKNYHRVIGHLVISYNQACQEQQSKKIREHFIDSSWQLNSCYVEDPYYGVSGLNEVRSCYISCARRT